MKNKKKFNFQFFTKSKNLIWIPRGMVIVYILFVSLFSLDVFSEGGNFLDMALGFFIHLIPSLILILILIFTWKKPKIAGVLFVLAGLTTIFFWNTYEELYLFLVFSFIPIITGILFWIFKGKK